MNKEMVDILIEESKKGNKEAMGKLFELHKGLVYKYSSKFFIKGYDRDDLEQIGWIEFINGVHRYDRDFGIDFIAFISILLRNKFGSMLGRKELTMKFSSLETPIGEDIQLKDMLEDDFSMEDNFEERETIGSLMKVLEEISEEDRKFILYVNAERGNLQKYYEEHKEEKTYAAIRHRKDKLMRKIRKGLKERKVI